MPASKSRPDSFRRFQPVFVVYRSAGAGLVREQFNRARIGAALFRAEFLERVEACPVYIQHGYRGKLVRAVS